MKQQTLDRQNIATVYLFAYARIPELTGSLSHEEILIHLKLLSHLLPPSSKVDALDLLMKSMRNRVRRRMTDLSW